MGITKNGHYFDNEPECFFCGCFGPTEEDEPCVSREEIGKQISFIINKLIEIKNIVKRPSTDIEKPKMIISFTEEYHGN